MQNDLHEKILECSNSNWQKVAMVISKVYLNSDNSYTEDEIGRGVTELVEAGRLESKGNIENWRFSEIRISC